MYAKMKYGAKGTELLSLQPTVLMFSRPAVCSGFRW